MKILGFKNGSRFWVPSVFAVPFVLIGCGLYTLMSVDTSACSLPGDPYNCLNSDPGPQSFLLAAWIGIVLPVFYLAVAAPIEWITRKWLG